MRIQSKLIFSILPALFLGFSVLSLWSFNTAKELMSKDAFRYIDTVLEARYEQTLKRRAMLLQQTKMDKVTSFVTLYQQEALDELRIGADSQFGCFIVLDQRRQKLFTSANCPADDAMLPQESVSSALSEEIAHQSPIRLSENNHHVLGTLYFEPWRWTLIYAIRTDRFAEASNQIFLMTLGLAGLCVLLCALVIVLAFRQVFGLPVLRLKAAAEQIANHEANVAIKIDTNDELGELAKSINSMAAAITSYIDQLQNLARDLEQSNAIMKQEISEREKVQTELKEALERVRKNEASLELATSSGNIGLWDWDLHSGEVYFSPIWKRQIGYQVDEIAGRYEEWECRLHPEDRAETIINLKAAQSPPWPPYNSEFRLLHRDGSYRWIFSKGALVFDEQGRTARMMGSHTDITDRKLAETQRKQLEAQLYQAQKMESVGRLAGGIAHDFNNLLGVILGYADLLLGGEDLTEEQRKFVEEIKATARRSADLTKQLLAFARKQDIVPETLDLNSAVTGMLEIIRRLIGETITLDWRPEPDLWRVKIDPSQIDQILANLCVNARDAMNGTGRIHIVLSNFQNAEPINLAEAKLLPGEYVVLTVADNGSGITKEDLAHIFEPFFSTKEINKGTGLGLATVYGIVKQNQGYIDITSEPGLGATFRVYLPRCKDQVPAVQVTKLEASDLSGHETILLVEDQPELLEVTQCILEQKGYRVLAADGSELALQLAEQYQGHIDLLITDVVMPTLNGRELATHLQRRFPQLRCLFMSGYTANVIAQNGVIEQTTNFIQKPFSLASLSKKVREILNKSPNLIQ